MIETQDYEKTEALLPDIVDFTHLFDNFDLPTTITQCEDIRPCDSPNIIGEGLVLNSMVSPIKKQSKMSNNVIDLPSKDTANTQKMCCVSKTTLLPQLQKNDWFVTIKTERFMMLIYYESISHCISLDFLCPPLFIPFRFITAAFAALSTILRCLSFALYYLFQDQTHWLSNLDRTQKVGTTFKMKEGSDPQHEIQLLMSGRHHSGDGRVGPHSGRQRSQNVYANYEHFPLFARECDSINSNLNPGTQDRSCLGLSTTSAESSRIVSYCCE
ncbi:unnamed protein product [Bursaphelenchus okinawaensis]|uniref:Uncharacterized protein n=1 Tax=Bursaphelenchus okinawaensis TaxID=465554 RepID=A0A811KIB4_9BILA|nr:unnamed protein product [Bursaphelenchus okinawaensis]CAG9103570.1 unnamed protein product [Bursaphelenchus okinawaensis]